MNEWQLPHQLQVQTGSVNSQETVSCVAWRLVSAYESLMACGGKSLNDWQSVDVQNC